MLFLKSSSRPVLMLLTFETNVRYEEHIFSLTEVSVVLRI